MKKYYVTRSNGEDAADQVFRGYSSQSNCRSLFIGEYELWLEAARRPELRDSARTWCATEQRVLAAALEQLGSSDPATDARLLVAALDGLGEQVLAADDPVGTARRLRPELCRLIERLVAG